VLWLALAALIPDGAFVKTNGAQFLVGDKPFAFVGANLAVMHGQARARAAATLQAARSDGFTVGRIWALGEGASDARPWSRENELFRAGPDGWIEPAFVQLDRVLAEARARGLRLIVTLSNHWKDYGGVPMYLRWAQLPTEGFGARDRFYSDARTRTFFRAHLEKLLQRTNTITGVRYVDDPTIFSWELMNESQVDGDEGARARLDFFAEMARFIKERDPHHLVSSGASIYTSRAERSEWLQLCELPGIDYCDGHLYPQTTDQVDDETRLYAYIDDRVQLARHVARKPIVFGEFGFSGDAWLGAPRKAWFEKFLARAFLDGAAGALAWIYQPWPGHDFAIYIDHDETDDLRSVLRGWARRALAPPAPNNPLLGDARGETLLYDPYRLVRHAPLQHDLDGVIEVPPERFSSGRFERVGVWNGGPLVQAYGAGDGWFEWRFTMPQSPSPHVIFIARLSSEFPGSTAPPDGGSHVILSIDGKPQAEFDVIADDGAGQIQRLPLDVGPGTHTLRLEVPPGPRAHGLCVYGEPTGNGAPPPGEATPLSLRFTPAESR
jgi:mannan endo-1,4-beta-mannosidase